MSLLTSRISQLATLHQRRCGRRDAALALVDRLGREVQDLVEMKQDIECARSIILHVAKQTQEQLQYRLSELATLALASVFDDGYEVQVLFDSKRGHCETSVVFARDGNQFEPMQTTGGGAVHVAAFALRLTLWKLSQSRFPVFILDEPFHFVSQDLQHRVSTLLRELSRELGVQMIIVTHEETLQNDADRLFEVSIADGVSTVTQIGGEQQCKEKSSARSRFSRTVTRRLRS